MNGKMRAGITLLITLSVIAAMLALVGVMFHYLDTARQQAQRKSALIEADLLYQDVARGLRRVLGKTPSRATLQAIYETPIAVQATREDFGVLLRCRPLAAGINVRWLAPARGSHQRLHTLAVTLFESLTEQANLKDAGRLLDRIVSAVKDGVTQRFGIESGLRPRKGVMSKELFYRIVAEYRFEEDDPAVYRIAWDRYFSFGEPLDRLDAEFASPELLAYLYDLDPVAVKESFVPGRLDSFLEEVGEERKRYAWLFAQKPVAHLECECRYDYQGRQYGFDFAYRDRKLEGFRFAHS